MLCSQLLEEAVNQRRVDILLFMIENGFRTSEYKKLIAPFKAELEDAKKREKEAKKNTKSKK